MFCRKCGKKLADTDRFCSFCGTPTGSFDEKSEPVAEPPKGLVWNVHDFSKSTNPTKSTGENIAAEPEVNLPDMPNEELQKAIDEEILRLGEKEAEEVPKQDFSSQIDEMAKARAVYFAESPLNDQEPASESGQGENPVSAPEPEQSREEARGEMPETLSEPAGPEAASEAAAAVVSGAAAAEPAATDESEEPPQKAKKSFWKGLLLAIIIILILLEGAYLAAGYFVPENRYYKQVSEKVGEGALYIQSLFGVDNQDDKTGDKPGEGKEGIAAQTEGGIVTEPAVETPAGNNQTEPEKSEYDLVVAGNKNIVDIKENPELGYKQGTKYPTADISSSVSTVENKVAILGKLVEYNSKWVDYVNSGDRAVTELTMQGSMAENNTKNFSQVGKIKETFNKLELGELRKGANGYYAWVRENITVESGGKTVTKVYNWIYQLAQVGDEFKIVNYYPAP